MNPTKSEIKWSPFQGMWRAHINGNLIGVFYTQLQAEQAIKNATE
jgi:hypothetical protein